MIIKDTKGRKLRLLKKAATLTEVTGEAVKGIKWSLDLRQLRRPCVPIVRLRDNHVASRFNCVHFCPEIRTLDCRKFTKKIFALILEVAQGAK